MSRGIAKIFKENFTSIKEKITNRLYKQEERNNVIYNLVTKDKYFNKPRVGDYLDALKQLEKEIIIKKIEKIRISPLGMCRDRIEKKHFKEGIESIINNTNAKVIVYYQNENEGDKEVEEKLRELENEINEKGEKIEIHVNKHEIFNTNYYENTTDVNEFKEYDYSEIDEIVNYYRENSIRDKSYQLYNKGIKNVEEVDKKLFAEVYEKYSYELDNDIGFVYFDKEGKKNKNIHTNRENDIFKKITNEYGKMYESKKEFHMDLNYDLKFKSSQHIKTNEIMFKGEKIKIYDVATARRDISLDHGYNKIMTGGFSNSGFDKFFGNDITELIYKYKAYSKSETNVFQYYEEKLKQLINPSNEEMIQIPKDEKMIKYLKEEEINVDQEIKDSNFYVTEKNPVHLMQSVARYGLSPLTPKELSNSLKKEECKWMYFYLRNTYENIGLNKWTSERKMISFNSSSSPGYLWNRKFNDNKGAERWSRMYIRYFDDLVEMGINPAMPFTCFEKLCIQNKEKIQEIRTISQAPVVHSIIGKQYSHPIEHAQSLNHGKCESRMAQQMYFGHTEIFCKRIVEGSDWIHREEDFSKQDIFENPIIMDIITQVRLDTMLGDEIEKNRMICIEEQNKRPLRVTHYGQFYRNPSKCSGGSHTCLNNTDKHMVVNSLLYAKMIAQENKIEFKEQNFKLLMRMIKSNNYIQSDVFSDDCLVHVKKSYEKYFITQDNEKSLQQQIMKKTCLYMKKSKIKEFKNKMTVEDINKEGVMWLGQYFYKNEKNKIIPFRPKNKIIFGLSVLNPESMVAREVIKETGSDENIKDVYRIMKLFSYMTMCVPNLELFEKLEKIRDKLVNEIRGRKIENLENLINKMYLKENERILGLYITGENIRNYGKNCDIWNRKDFEFFITERRSFYSNPEIIQRLIYESYKNGVKNIKDSNKLYELLQLIGWKFEENKNSKLNISNCPKEIFSKDLMPFVGVNEYNIPSIIRKLSFAIKDVNQDKKILLTLLKNKIIKSKINVEYQEIKYLEDMELKKVMLTHYDMKMIESQIQKFNPSEFKIILPVEGKILCSLNELIYKNRNQLIYCNSNNEIKVYSLEDIFERYEIIGDETLIENYRVKTYVKNEFWHLKKKTTRMAKNCKQEKNEKNEICEKAIYDNEFTTKEINFEEMDILGYNHKKDSKKIKIFKNLLENWTTGSDKRFIYLMLGENIKNKEGEKVFEYYNGGPGCGKTEKMIKKIEESEKQGKKILFTSSANDHVINACERMIKYGLRFRIDFSENALKNGSIPKEIQKYKNTKGVNILCKTTAMIMRKGNSFTQNFDVLVVDECSRMTIMDVFLMLGPCGLKGNFKKVLLFGDKYQANIFNPNNFKTKLYYPVSYLMDESSTVYLNESFRLRENTIDLLNKVGYFEKPLISKNDKNKGDEFIVKYFCTSIDGIHYEEQEKDAYNDEESFKNKLSAKRVTQDFEKDETESKVILTPYVGQKKYYDELGYKAMTIDGAQSKEWERVYLDLTRCNQQGKIGFSNELYRFIVAVSRHRNQLKMYCCNSCIKGTYYEKIVTSMSTHREMSAIQYCHLKNEN